MSLCAECYLQGFCRRLQSRVVTLDELTPQFLTGFRAYVRSKGISRDQWIGWLDAAYRDYPGRIVDAQGHEVSLDMSVFDRPHIRDWFRDLLKRPVAGIQPRLRREAVPRYIAMASILRAVDPVPAMLWGKDIANDEDAVLPMPAIGKDCRYRHFAYRS